MSYDIFNPMLSTIARGLEGKMILVYGNNSTGKTKQGIRSERPFYLGFEKGIRAISGVPFLPINNWRDFKKINRQLTSPRTVEKAREVYQTIIFDEVYTSAQYCQDYLCEAYNVNSIGDGNKGYGLWKEYEKEFFGEMDKLMNAGYTLYFIGHPSFSKEEDKIVPHGDSRSMGLIRNNADIVIYLTSNGVDENKEVIPSSAWLAETDKFFARSRFDYIDTYIEEYSVENLEKVVEAAIEKQEEKDGVRAVSFTEQRQSMQSEKLNFNDLMDELKEVGTRLQELDKTDELLNIIEKHLGEGGRISECKKGQEQIMAVILDEIKDLLDEVEDEE